MDALGQMGTGTIKPDGTTYLFEPLINLGVPGQRIITPTAVTGEQNGDILPPAPGAIQFAMVLPPGYNVGKSERVALGNYITDQGIADP